MDTKPNPEQTEEEQRRRLREYRICLDRGHQSDGLVLTSIPPQQRCKWCGTRYFYTEPEMIEMDAP